MADTLGYGIVGFGRVAEQHVKRAEGAQMELLAACDGSPERRAVAASLGAMAYEDFREMLGHPGLELVIVCTPPDSHCDLTVRAVEARKHVMVEKPFALNLEEAHRMVDAARNSGLVITAHQNRRYDGDFLTVRKILETGLLGEAYAIESRKMAYMETWSTWGTPEFKPEWRSKRDYGGGLVYDWGSHLGDQVLQIAPAEVESVFADLQSRVWSDEVDDHFRAIVRFTDGSTSTIEVSANARLELPRWHISGDKGTLVSEGKAFKLKTADAEYDFACQSSTPELVHQNLYEAIRNGAELLIKPKEILRTVRLLDSIFDSAKIGEAIRWQ